MAADLDQAALDCLQLVTTSLYTVTLPLAQRHAKAQNAIRDALSAVQAPAPTDAAAVERVARALARFGRNDPTIEATIERVERTWRRYIPEAEAALRAARGAG